jgi:hypothetical protein
MTHAIFLLHGIGGEDATWADQVKSQLMAQYGEYKFSKQLPFAENFEFAPLLYNDEFEKYWKAWDDNAAKLGKWGKVLAPLDNSFVNTMTEIAKRKAGDSFVVRYVGDVLLYIPCLRCPIVRPAIPPSPTGASRRGRSPFSASRWSRRRRSGRLLFRSRRGR